MPDSVGVDQPNILSQQREGELLTYKLKIPKDTVYFQGHFEQLALLPGVVQITWAVALSVPLLGEIHTKHIKKLKFTAPIFPAEILHLDLNSENPGRLTFRYYQDDTTFSEGVIYYDNK